MKKNVAGQKIGAQLVSSADGTAFTGSVTVAVCGDAGTQTTGSVGSGACTHEGNGYHTYAPSQAETNFDLVAFTFTGTGAVPVTVQIYTRPTTGLLAPTVDGRTLDVSAGGEAGLDWANVGSPTTTLNLSGTTISTSQAVASVSGSVGSVASFGSLVSDIATAVWGAGTRTLTAISDSSGITTLLSRILGTLASGTHNPQSGDSFARLGAPSGASIAADIADLPTNSELSTALAAADDATLSAISAIASTLATITGLIDTEIASIKTKTDGLPADTAAALTAIQGYVDALETEVAKIIKSGEEFTATDGTGSKTATFTRVA